MARRASVDESDLDLRTLERQFRETERKDDLASTLRTQTIAIDKLAADNKQLKAELEIVQRDLDHSQQSNAALRTLQAKIEYYESEIESERENLAELERTLAGMEGQLKDERKKASARSQDPAHTVTGGHIKTLENRLETALREYNSSLTQNSQYRSTIDHLKQERGTFDALSRRLGREIQELKKQTAEIIDKSTQAYEVRDEALAKITALREKSEKELAQYATEIKELTRVLEHERKLRNFMVAKGQDRKDVSATQTLSRTRRAAEAAARDSTPEERLATLERCVAEIKAIAGVQETDKAVEKFIQGERENFSAFNLVNELNNTIEQLQEKIAELSAKAEAEAASSAANKQQAQRTLDQLNAATAEKEAQISAQEALRDQARSEVEALAGPIEELFAAIGCERTALDETLGNAHVNTTNIKLFLTIIEQRANALLQLQARLDAFAKKRWEQQEADLRDRALHDEDFDPIATLGPKPALTSLLGPGPQPAAGTATLHPPTTEALSDHDDVEDDSPLSLEEIKARIKSGDVGLNRSKQSTKKAAHTSILRNTTKKR